jgi:hypothetical protein
MFVVNVYGASYRVKPDPSVVGSKPYCQGGFGFVVEENSAEASNVCPGTRGVSVRRIASMMGVIFI